MTTFNPIWDLKADTSVIVEGADTFIRLSINRKDTTEGNEYSVLDNEYLEIKLKIGGNGETYSDSDYTLYIGESTSSLQPISNGTTGNTAISGNHTIRLAAKYFDLQGSTLKKDVYFLKLHCVDDQTWDGPKDITFTLESVIKYTIIDDQIANSEDSGTIRLNSAIITYDDSKEIWVTPGITTGEDKKLYTIGGLSYGGNSTIFVQAFGRSRDYNGNTDNDDLSIRVFYPLYRHMPYSVNNLPIATVTGKRTVLNPSTSAFPIVGKDKEIPITIVDDIGNIVNTGTKFNPNGQILQTMLYQSDPVDAFINVRLESILSSYTTPNEAFDIGCRFKAYQMWVCPTDASYIKGGPKPGHLYQLHDNSTYPYVVKGEYENGVLKPSFVEADWNDLGYYDEGLGAGMIGQERLFRVLVNASTGDDMQFETDSNLGEIHVGEYFGHSVYPVIKATGTLVTYRLTGGDDIRKYGLDLTADGILVGTAYARNQDFSANDDINLTFNVTANDKSGSSVKGDFKLRIIRGFGPNYLSSHLVPSVNFEREWFKCISSPTFASQGYYRQSDDHYGLRKVPRMLLKENFVSQNYNFSTLNNLKTVLRKGIIDVTGGAPVPTAAFGLVIGNYKIISALDNNGSLLYDILFREIHPSGTEVPVSLNPRQYTEQDVDTLTEIFGLRQNIFKLVGEDVTNLLSDPTDFANRGLIVDAIHGLSDEMIDTVPRFMNHPYIEDGVKAGFMPIIPVAYFMPGQAEAFFNKLIQNNEHSLMVGTEFEVSQVEFGFFAQQYANYVPNKFMIPLISSSLL